MSPLTQRDVLAHQAAVPWPSALQVEQDLLLCRSMHAIFSDAFLREHVALRGGTVLHKVHLAPPARYSEDLDLVATSARPEAHLRKALTRVLGEVLGKPARSAWGALSLAVRNAARPSRVLRSTYDVASVAEPGRTVRIVVETNVTERHSHRGIVAKDFEFELGGSTLRCVLRSFDIHEILGTKMRALFQRTQGRDLFDLYHALRTDASIDARTIVDAFLHYMDREGTLAHREEFVALLEERLRDRGFRSDMHSLLRPGVDYDVQAAAALVKERLLSLLPPAPGGPARPRARTRPRE